jgi:hypothetical protein
MDDGVTCLVFNAVFDAVGTPERKSDCGTYADQYAQGYVNPCLWLPNASETPAVSPTSSATTAKLKQRTAQKRTRGGGRKGAAAGGN